MVSFQMMLYQTRQSHTWEGKSKEVTQTRYERNPQARKTCLKHYGYSCQICNFNFEKTFGEIGKGFIHVHHVNAIAGIGKGC